MEHVLVVHGPNLNLLGARRPDVYGSATLGEVDDQIAAWGAELGLEIETYQSNHEGALIDRLHGAIGEVDGILLNPGALTHYSYALHDAVEAVQIPVIEVHVSNIKAREEWRRHSVIAPACIASIHGRGVVGYHWALRHLVHRASWLVTTIPYAEGPERVGDLRLPAGDPPHPVAVLLHGGFWREPWTRDQMDSVAVDLARRGYATWNLEFHRVGGTGGYPATLDDVAAGIDFLATLAPDHGLALEETVFLGHGSGGQLALWAASRSGLEPDEPGTGPGVHPVLAVGLAPVADLAAAHEMGLADDAVEDFLRRNPETGPERYLAASPAERLPLGVDQLIVHGDGDDAVPASLSRDYVVAAREAGDDIEYAQIAGAGHFDLIDPSSDAWARIVAEI
jgi:3-dehydroquinate dehydratase type II